MPSIRPRFPIALKLLLLSGCAASPSDGGEIEALAADLQRDLGARAEQAAAAARRSGDPWDLWSAFLELGAPEVLAARRDLARARARERALGVPPTMLDAEHMGDGGQHETQLMLAFDLPGLLGIGRTGAAQARARLAAAREEAALAAASFRARHGLERALAALAVARALEEELAGLEAECAPAEARLDLLSGRGWLPPDRVDAARTMLHHVAAMRLEQVGAIASARAAVARASGLAPDSSWLDDPEACGLRMITRRTERRGDRADPDARELLATHPDLDVARLDYLGAEADLRTACAERWPALWIGPNAMLTADDLFLGGVLRLELPWPPAAGAAVDAARAARDAARALLANELAAGQTALVQRRAELASAERALREHGEAAAEAAARWLRAAQARFAVDAEALPEWTMAIDQRARALLARAAALSRWLIATFDLSEALGRPPAVTRAAAAGTEGGR